MDCFAALAMTVSARWHSTPHSHISRHRPPTGPRNARPDDRLRRNPPSRRRPEHHVIDHGSGEAALRRSPGGSRRFRQHIEMTREPLTVPGGPKLRLLAPAAIEHEWTPGVEAASAGQV